MNLAPRRPIESCADGAAKPIQSRRTLGVARHPAHREGLVRILRYDVVGTAQPNLDEVRMLPVARADAMNPGMQGELRRPRSTVLESAPCSLAEPTRWKCTIEMHRRGAPASHLFEQNEGRPRWPWSL